MLHEGHSPNIVISLSHEVSPEAREFDRLCTTIANAYIQPLMARLSGRLSDAVCPRSGLQVSYPDDDGWRRDDDD